MQAKLELIAVEPRVFFYAYFCIYYVPAIDQSDCFVSFSYCIT